MSYRTDEPIEVRIVAHGDFFRFFAGPFASVPYDRPTCVRKCLERFPAARVAGRPVAEVYADELAPAKRSAVEVERREDGTPAALILQSSLTHPDAGMARLELLDRLSKPIEPEPVAPAMTVKTANGGTLGPHVFVKGADGYCVMCDNAQANPIHTPPRPLNESPRAVAAAEGDKPKSPRKRRQ